jgi:hypothetical protein
LVADVGEGFKCSITEIAVRKKEIGEVGIREEKCRAARFAEVDISSIG